MKKLLLLIILFITLSATSQTSVYHSFPDSAIWRVDTHGHYNQLNCDENSYYNYYIAGDTIINSGLYKKIIKDTVILVATPGYNTCNICATVFYINGYRGAIREDSIANKVFFISPDSTNEKVLFDYNLLAGDTMHGITSLGLIVNSVDSIQVGSQYRKRWNLFINGTIPGYVIEGIGSNCGLLEPIQVNTWCQSNLVCVKGGSTILFSSGVPSPYGCTNIFSAIEELESINEITISPNPFTSQTTITFSEEQRNTTLKITDILGKEIRTIQVNGKQVIIEKGEMKEGIYFLQVMDEKKNVMNRKIIIQ